jgi:hypothetical protein
VKLWPLIAVGRVVVVLPRIVEETGVALDLLHEPVNEGVAVLLGGVHRLMSELWSSRSVDAVGTPHTKDVARVNGLATW